MGMPYNATPFDSIRWIVALLGVLGGFLLIFGGLGMLTSSLKSERRWLERALFRYAESPFLSFILGTLVTAIIQSSSLVTVVTVAMVDTGLFSLDASIPVILGANLGTTVTAHLVTMDLRIWSAAFLCTGFILLATRGFGGTRNRMKSRPRPVTGAIPATPRREAEPHRRRPSERNGLTRGTAERPHLAGSFVGVGLVLFGLDLISKAALPLTAFLSWNRIVSSPLLGLLWGVVATALIQSSSAVTVIIAIVARGGMLTPQTTLPLIFGANVGTCVTALVASLGRSKPARQAALAHLLINCIGVAAALLILEPFSLVVGLTSHDPARQVANGHTLFNVFNAMLVYPFLPYLSCLVRFLTGESAFAPPGRQSKVRCRRRPLRGSFFGGS